MLAYQVNRTRCGEPDCDGAAILADRCLAHLDAGQQTTVLAGSGWLDARGVTVDDALLRRIGRASRSVNFDDARFVGPIMLEGAAFGGVSFKHAHFEEQARFHRVTFGTDAEFDSCTFGGDAHLAG